MTRIKCEVAYDGTLFFGYQVQPEKRTVQREIEKVLATIHKGTQVKTIASGRTDAGVHAKGQVIHFDSPLSIPIEKWPKVLNSQLPGDIVVITAIYEDAEFHARYSVKQKEYRYEITLGDYPSPFGRNYSLFYPYSLDLEKVKQAANYLKGEHDFTSFCSAKTEVEDKVRTIQDISFTLKENNLQFSLIGNGFLYNMVRIIIGTLLEVGQGLKEPEDMIQILESKDRSKAGKTAPAHGLYLWKVYY